MALQWQRTGVDFSGANQAMAGASQSINNVGKIAEGFVDRIREDEKEATRKAERQQDVDFRNKSFSLQEMAAQREEAKWDREKATEEAIGLMQRSVANGLLPQEQAQVEQMAASGKDPTELYNKLLASRGTKDQLAAVTQYQMPEGNYDRSKLLQFQQTMAQPLYQKLNNELDEAAAMERLNKELAARQALQASQQAHATKLAKMSSSGANLQDKLQGQVMLKVLDNVLVSEKDKSAIQEAMNKRHDALYDQYVTQGIDLWGLTKKDKAGWLKENPYPTYVPESQSVIKSLSQSLMK